MAPAPPARQRMDVLSGNDTRSAAGTDRSLAAAVRRAASAPAVDPHPAHALRVIEILARERRSPSVGPAARQAPAAFTRRSPR